MKRNLTYLMNTPVTIKEEVDLDSEIMASEGANNIKNSDETSDIIPAKKPKGEYIEPEARQ